MRALAFPIVLFIILVSATLVTADTLDYWEAHIPVLILDFVLLLGVFNIYLGHVFVGELKKSFNYISIGIVFFATNHIAETIMLSLGFSIYTSEIVHRLLHLAGLSLVTYGFYRIRSTGVPKKQKTASVLGGFFKQKNHNNYISLQKIARKQKIKF